jgi:hypothetical protein
MSGSDYGRMCLEPMPAVFAPLTRLQSRYSARYGHNVYTYLLSGFVPAEAVYEYQASGFGASPVRGHASRGQGEGELLGGHGSARHVCVVASYPVTNTWKLRTASRSVAYQYPKPVTGHSAHIPPCPGTK